MVQKNWICHQSKARTLWCTLDNRAADKTMPAVTFEGVGVERTIRVTYPGIHFDRMFNYYK